jgi:hypothetical protein
MAMTKVKVGRPLKLGKIPCPDPSCVGHLQLGRIREKTGRNRSTGRYVKRDWFRHNDSSIKEHYIDYFTRPPPDQKPVMDDIHDSHVRIVHYIKKLFNKIMTFPLDREELLWLCGAMKWHDDNVIAPMKILWYIAQGKIKASSKEYNQLIDIFNENVLSDKNVFGLGYKRLYLKYDRPRRLERNKKRNKKLSEWSGRKTYDYTGIYTPTN